MAKKAKKATSIIYTNDNDYPNCLINMDSNGIVSFHTDTNQVVSLTKYNNPSIVNLFNQTVEINGENFRVTFSVTKMANKTKATPKPKVMTMAEAMELIKKNSK